MYDSNLFLSVIIPVYNTPREYIYRCLNSIEAQTYKNVEIVIINDGSELDYDDLWMELKDNLEIKFTIINKDNGGVSSARNAGIKASSGDYVMFVDPDDELACDTSIAEAMKYAKDFDAEIVCGRVAYRFANDDYEYPFNFHEDKLRVYKSKKEIESFIEYFFSYAKQDNSIPSSLNRGPVARVFKRSVINDLIFDERLKFAEDAIFNCEAFARATCVVLVDSVWYYYYQYSNSLSHSEDASIWEKGCEVALSHVPFPYERFMPAYWSFCRHGVISSCLSALRSKGIKSFKSVDHIITSDWACKALNEFDESAYIIPGWELLLVKMARRKKIILFYLFGLCGCIFLKLNGKKLIG